MTTTPNTGVQQTAAPEDPFDRRLALAATGLLGDFNRAGILDAADVHVATRLCALRPAADNPGGSASVGGGGASAASAGVAGVKPGPPATNLRGSAGRQRATEAPPEPNDKVRSP